MADVTEIKTTTAVWRPVKGTLWREVSKHRALYLLISPAILLTILFSYVPMPGIYVAFLDYDIFMQLRSPFVGLQNFIEVFTLPMFLQSIANTLVLSILTLAVTFPAAIILALLLNEMKNGLFKRFVQTVSYLPHFFSWITVIGMAYAMYAMYGPVNDAIVSVTGKDADRILFLGQQWFFVPNILVMTLWKNAGWNTIMYLAALTAIDPTLYEAAHIDGAGRWRRLWHITLPGIRPTIVMLLIFGIGGLLGSNFELVYGLQNSFIDFEVISTIVYKQGINQGQYSLATALGLAQGIVSFILLYTANRISKKLTQTGIF
ncbi:ABC transporter permease [Paenibacillus roseipurpureus]|uniref:ABC transporter permease subunit n=1 Tax=Paenibacillus roseopurpureus TaxID=2918901 RepID=A0AA96LRK5_9BACL|nr:ABC transporter permease subunit [Paenibacillus sp. MBLB1832]WNR45281.1 ABC transporter permease subunit [Paenibacillus sp. MBLB1832]